MNFDHAVQTITKRGFTERQARFLILVARHSGVCVMRQYSTFAGIVFGQKTRKFFANLLRAKLVSRGPRAPHTRVVLLRTDAEIRRRGDRQPRRRSARPHTWPGDRR